MWKDPYGKFSCFFPASFCKKLGKLATYWDPLTPKHSNIHGFVKVFAARKTSRAGWHVQIFVAGFPFLADTEKIAVYLKKITKLL